MLKTLEISCPTCIFGTTEGHFGTTQVSFGTTESPFGTTESSSGTTEIDEAPVCKKIAVTAVTRLQTA
jgi:hypothetical protein